MNLDLTFIRKLSGLILIIMGALMLPSTFIAIVSGEFDGFRMFGILFAALVLIGFLIYFPVRKYEHQIKAREGFFTVSFCWLLASLLGTLPWIFSGILPNFIDAFFESVSAITTTGSEMIGHAGTLPAAIVFWHSLMCWIGGLGILLLVISILPALGIGTANMADAEAMISGIDKYRLRVSETAKAVYLTYFIMSAAAILLLLPSRIGLLDSVTSAFSCISNSGVSNFGGHGNINNFYIEIVLAVFCIIGSMNFSSLQLIPKKRFKDFIRDPEICLFFLIIISAFVLITLDLWLTGTYESLAGTVKGTLLQTVSFTTTAGYTVTDYNSWPVFCKMMIFFLAFIGGCSASTAGGLKVSRFAVILMLIRRNFYKRLHPNAVVAVKVGNRVIPSDKVSNITVSALLYFLIFAISSILLSLDGHSLETTFSAVLTSLSNTGPIFGDLASFGSYMMFSQPAKLFLALLMLIGRLEIFAILVLFTPSFWRKNN